MNSPSSSGPMECLQCGKPHPRCSGHRSSDPSQPCMKYPKKDFTVCQAHGGEAPQVKAAVERRQQERSALLALESFGIPVVVDPHTALLQELHRSAGHVEWLGAVVADTERGGLAERSSVSGLNEPSVWVRLYQGERKHYLDVAKACHAAGIEDHRIELEQRDARMVVAKFERALTRMRLTDEQKHEFKVIAAEEFLAIEGGGVG